MRYLHCYGSMVEFNLAVKLLFNIIDKSYSIDNKIYQHLFKF